MKRLFALFAAMLMAGVSFGIDNEYLRVTVSGYRLGESGAVVASLSSDVVKLTPTTTSLVKQGASPLTVVAEPGFGYQVVGWQQFDIDPKVRETTPKTIGGATDSVQVAFTDEANWVYVVAVLAVDNARSITFAKSHFGEGAIGHEYGTFACEAGEVFNLQAVPAVVDGVAVSEFHQWENGSTAARRTVTVKGNEKIVAEFVPAVWKVTFDAAGGKVVPTSKRVVYGYNYGALPTPTRDGYAFAGWQTAKGSSVSDISQVGAVGNHTLKAQWSAQGYKITIKMDGTGTGSVANAGVHAYGEDVELVARPDSGSHFVRWDDGSTNPRRTVTVTKNVTYTVTFDKDVEPTKEYTITFRYNDQEGKPQTLTDKMEEGTLISFDAIDGVARAWENHTFIGWQDSTGKMAVPGEERATGNRQFNAVYLGVVNVVYHGQGVERTDSYTNENEIVVKDYFAKEGYKLFWKDDKKSYKPGDRLNLSAGRYDFYADTSTPITYKIKYVKNDGTAKEYISERIYTYDVENNLLSPDIPEFEEKLGNRTGFDMIGYARDSSAQTPEYDYWKKVKNLTTVDNDIVVLYCIWEAQ